jgi:proline iminopeptidase
MEGILMKRMFLFILSILMLSSVNAQYANQEKEKKRETVLDRVVHIEKKLITKIPKAPRWCDKLDLKKKRINVGDCELYCEVEGIGMPIVLLHGGPGSTHHHFHPYFSKAKEFAKVIYYDQRGCGLSDYEPGEGYTVDQAVDDLENLRKALNIDKWVVLGHSYGGLLAQSYTIKYPESVAGLVLVCSSLAMHIPLKPTRQYDYISREEMERIEEIYNEGRKLHNKIILFFFKEKAIELGIYNFHINGDWKRQNYYKPSRERIAQIALYEWKQDKNFNSIMNSDAKKYDLQGVFDDCPIPTIIIEGKWDLTWNTDKPEKLHKNHPHSQLIMFEHSSHSPFGDEPENFFNTLQDFIQNLPKISESELFRWEKYLIKWREEWEKSATYTLGSVGWGRKSNEKIGKLYSEDWLEQLNDPFLLLKTGMALYDLKRYEEALIVFQKMFVISGEDRKHAAQALIWQGQMLDLLGRRKEAISIYKKAVGLNVTSSFKHSQFGLAYKPSIYAAERIKKPFKRKENRQKD